MASKTKKLTPRQKAFVKKRREGRNDLPYDIWSLVHLATGIFWGWIMPPFVALTIMVLWEPLEIFVLSPLFAKVYIDFGYETAKNSFSDIIFDVLGVSIGYFVLLHYFVPPFHFF